VIGRNSVLRVLAISAFVLVLPLLFFLSSSAASNSVTASFIDVGQGDSILLQDGSGFHVLIDGGKPSAGPTVLAYLRDLGVDDIEVMIASHSDSDHIGGLIDVFEANDIPVESVLYNGYAGSTATWFNFETAVANEGLTLAAAQFPDVYTWGTMTAYVLNPSSGLSSPDQNDASVVILVNHGNVDFLFTGDIGSSIEATVVARGTPVASEILKAAHHGSKYSSSADFLSAVGPVDSVIMVGSNSYGHPTDETLTRLSDAGANILRTDLDGTVVIESNGLTHRILAPLIQNFSDVPFTHWAWRWIESLFLAGMTAGFPDGSYQPENSVTRAEMSVFLAKGIHGAAYTPPTPDGSHPFSDVAGHWGEAWIEHLYDEGFTSGYPDGTYRPNYQVSRAEMAVFLLKAMHGSGYTPPAPSGGSFTDVGGHWAEAWIEQLNAEGITSGYPDGTYRPGNAVSRAEMAVFLVNTFAIPLVDPPPIPTPTPTPLVTSTPLPTFTPIPTVTPVPVANVQITYIFYDGVVPSVESDEYAQITNQGAGTVNLLGWRLNAGDPGQDFYFPSFLINPGQSCRVYTNEFHPEYCGFNFGRGSAIWSNSGDCGYLYDGGGSLVSTYCY
jgi:beta-lactamase superfamily II metal-dependent hydrolase